VQEYRLTPNFTINTHILILTAGVASWTQIGDARRGATVIQSLPSGNIGDVSGAQSATLERVWIFEEGGDDIDIVQIGRAYLAANHPILTVDGWILASQAAAKGHGKLPSDRKYSQLCGLQLATGGNILINISTSQDLSSVYTEAATMGYCFLSPSDPLNGNFPTYASQGTGPRDGYVAQTKPSYSQVTAFNHKRLSKRPILPLTLFTPETHASPKSIDASEKTAKEHKREPITGISATVHLVATTAQRTPEEYSGDLDVARTGSHRIRPAGVQKSCREAMQGDGPGHVDEGHETVRRVHDNRDGSTGNAIEVQSHRGITGPLLPRVPASSGAGLDKEQTNQRLIKHIMLDEALSHQEKQLHVQAIWADKVDEVNMSASFTNHRARPSPPITLSGPASNTLIELEVLPLKDTTNTTRHITPAIETLADSSSVPNPPPGRSRISDTYPDILIQTPGGKRVPEHEIRWGSNPHSRDGGDNLQLLEVLPGQHLFQANPHALTVCNLVESDPRSQFYKSPPILEDSTPSSLPFQRWDGLIPEPPYLLGNSRTIKRRELYAARRQGRDIEEKEQIVMTIPRDNAIAPSPDPRQGRPDTNLGVPSISQGPTLTETEATLHDNNLFYRNGNPKPKIDPTARPLARGLTSKARKRLGGRKRNRRRNQRGRPSDEVSKEPNPTILRGHREETNPP